jgi:hypothetical protein
MYEYVKLFWWDPLEWGSAYPRTYKNAPREIQMNDTSNTAATAFGMCYQDVQIPVAKCVDTVNI